MKKLLCILCLLAGVLFFNSAKAYYYRPYRSYSYTRHYGHRSFYRHYRAPIRRSYGYRRHYHRYW